MKINNHGLRGVNPYQQQIKNVPKKETNAQNKGDKVEISTAAKDLQQLQAADKKRAEKLNEIKRQVESGTYKLDPKQIAEGILKYYQSIRK